MSSASPLSLSLVLLILTTTTAYNQFQPFTSYKRLSRSTNHYKPISKSSRSVIQSGSTTDSKTYDAAASSSGEEDENAVRKNVKQRKRRIPQASPVFVSDEVEALSHSPTTMKLIPSYELFQILPESEGGYTSESALTYYENLAR